MTNLNKAVLVSILLTVVLVLLAANMVHAVGVTATIQVGTSFPTGVVYDSGKGEIFVFSDVSSTISVISDSSNSVVANVTSDLSEL